MPSRAHDWLAQGERDLLHARHALADGDLEWACFAAHQSAEKALKAVYQYLGGEARGHDLNGLLRGLEGRVRVPRVLVNQVRELGKHYIATRYPNAHAEGAPFQHYTKVEANRAIRHAEAVLRFCGDHLA